MTSERFNLLVTKARVRQDQLLKAKGADYTRHSKDRLSNFKRNAEAIGLDALQVWAVYAGKHWDAIMTFIKTGKAESEAIEGRLDDLHNYLYLLEGLIEEGADSGPDANEPGTAEGSPVI
jgi:hypothetical protein